MIGLFYAGAAAGLWLYVARWEEKKRLMTLFAKSTSPRAATKRVIAHACILHRSLLEELHVIARDEPYSDLGGES